MMEAAKNLRVTRDRISSLPDYPLHLIMSFLTAQEAVRTCILSKRWKNLWTTSPFLNFDLSEFKYNNRPEYGEIEYSESEDSELEDSVLKCRRFRDFVNLTLLLRQASDLQKFRLSCADMPGHMNNMFTRSCIRYVLKHNPQVLEINTIMDDPLPLNVFSCVSLVNLSLSFGSRIPLSLQYGNNIVVVNLPFLRRLHLKCIFVNQDFMEKLFCGCPMLEFLQLHMCKIEFSSICSQSLKYLKLDHCCRLEGTNKMELINAPSLLSFNYSRCIGYIGHTMLLNMPSLTRASICCERCICGQYNGKSNIFTGISNVQSLELSGFWIKDIVENELSTCPEFLNVKDLFVDDFCLDCHFNLLASFLDHFPNLKKLSLCCSGLCCVCQVKVDRNQGLLKITPFRCERLQVVDVRFSYRYKNFHWVLKYLQDATKDLYAGIIMTCERTYKSRLIENSTTEMPAT